MKIHGIFSLFLSVTWLVSLLCQQSGSSDSHNDHNRNRNRNELVEKEIAKEDKQDNEEDGDPYYPPFGHASTIRNDMALLSHHGQFMDLIHQVETIHEVLGTLKIDNKTPSLYSYYGVALYNAQRVEEAKHILEEALLFYPNETNTWTNLGEMRVQTFELDKAIEAFNKAYQLGDNMAIPRLIRTKGWSADWKSFDLFTSVLEELGIQCQQEGHTCPIDSNGGIEYTDLPGEIFCLLTKLAPAARMDVLPLIPYGDRMTLQSPDHFQLAQKKNHRVKIGLLSSDFGVHPVSSLIRGMIASFWNDSIVELHCFSLQTKISWWGENISNSRPGYFHYLTQMNLREAALAIARHEIDIMIDLNGHTMYSGLSILAHRPAPIQISFLGLPTTTGAAFIDYYISDPVASPPEHRGHYSEALAYIPPSYIVNDFAQLQGHVGNERLGRSNSDVLPINREVHMSFMRNISQLAAEGGASEDEHVTHLERLLKIQNSFSRSSSSLIFGTLSNSQKMDPLIFQVWMQILSYFPESVLVFFQYAGHQQAIPHLLSLARLYGISPFQLLAVEQSPWIDHLQTKTALDLALDTFVKNGHTTGLDAQWAGIPTVSFAYQSQSSSRAGQSIAAGLDSSTGLAVSLKDYEDLVLAILRDDDTLRSSKSRRSRKWTRKNPSFPGIQKEQKKETEDSSKKTATQSNEAGNSNSKGGGKGVSNVYHRLAVWRQQLWKLRRSSVLFDTRFYTKSFTHLIQAIYEARYISTVLKDSQYSGIWKEKNSSYHIIQCTSRAVQKQGLTPVEQVYTDESSFFPTSFSTATTSTSVRGGGGGEVNSKQYHAAPSSMKSRKGNEEGNGDTWPPIPDEIFDGRLILLNIGGIQPARDWLNVNFPGGALVASFVPDIHRPMHNLYGLPDSSVSAIYTSHTLEHSSFGDNMLVDVLNEWFRVLRPGGILLVSVPDLAVLTRLYLSEKLTLEQRWMVTRMIYGAQSDEHDYHYVGFDFTILETFLSQAGFCNITRVSSFKIGFVNRHTETPITDSSDMVYLGHTISLNVVAKVCPESKPQIPYDGFQIEATSAIPFISSEVRIQQDGLKKSSKKKK
eukprot:scaffold5806_cov171-Ochromonas_danica.AAC.5